MSSSTAFRSRNALLVSVSCAALLPTSSLRAQTSGYPSPPPGQASYPQQYPAGQQYPAQGGYPQGYSAQPQPGYPGQPTQGSYPQGAYPPGKQSPGSCVDGVRNGLESDVDCGGDCSPCEIGDQCNGWRDCWSGRCAEGECEERAYELGMSLPPGYDVETSTHDGAATARYFGAGFFAAGYGAAYVGAVANPTELAWLFAPVIGPWITMGKVDSGEVLLAVDGVLQGAGALVLIGGLIGSGKQLVRQELPPPGTSRVEVHYFVGSRSVGLFGSF